MKLAFLNRTSLEFKLGLVIDHAIDIALKILLLTGKVLHLLTYNTLVDPYLATAIYFGIASFTYPYGNDIHGWYIFFVYLIYWNRQFYESDGKVSQSFLEILYDKRFFLKLRRDTLRWSRLSKRNKKN